METIRVVNAGPNAKLAYLRAPPFSIVGYYRVNRIALAEQSVFWQRQPVRQHTTVFGIVMCGRADVVPFIPVVLSHEGANLEPKSHAFFFNEELQRHNAQEIEDLTSDMGSAEVEDGARNEIIDQAERWTTGILEKAAEKDDQADNKRNAPQYCSFSYFSRN